MRHLDVLVLPSYQEPFGTVLAEAMAVGTPVVATRVDGLPEVVRDGVDGPARGARAIPARWPRPCSRCWPARARWAAAARGAPRRFDADALRRAGERLLTR